ncbi:serine O-acetyltransferase EpsC [Sphaerochaeta sp. PS]|uniref:serine O-acetyltransferase EpsC n=1 Tax=Sphaerochaeta sp. PS TaxID=3076336 RepID=UPI0028A537B4|nr:serine O-acetyltransferase EpsC [Sphaerochaeta sp. PS]MDT4762360.1 serine O-acetyltransferase EpsC [Sphaerochaeta sp. PS]
MKECREQNFDATAFIPSFLETFDRAKGNSNFYGMKQLPQMLEIGEIANEFIELMFPGRCGRDRMGLSLQEILLDQMNMVCSDLKTQIFLALRYEKPEEDEEELKQKSEHIIKSLCALLPQIRIKLKLDARAGFDGDPAARTVREVILSYPCIKTLAIHRIAHELFRMNVPLIPRMLNEFAHKETGIDIHPGAEIGQSFFIDHGTGVVIGETAVIGNNVKIYQGVTLGALSFPKDACGALIRGARRHPTIEDNVTIYSNATILGDITIGKNAVIGSNVWIKESVPENTMAAIQEPKLTFRDLNGKKH